MNMFKVGEIAIIVNAEISDYNGIECVVKEPLTLRKTRHPISNVIRSTFTYGVITENGVRLAARPDQLRKKLPATQAELDAARETADCLDRMMK